MPEAWWVVCDDDLVPAGYASLLVMVRGAGKSSMFCGSAASADPSRARSSLLADPVEPETDDPRPHGGAGDFRIAPSA